MIIGIGNLEIHENLKWVLDSADTVLTKIVAWAIYTCVWRICHCNLMGRFHGNSREEGLIATAFPWKRPMRLKLQVQIASLFLKQAPEEQRN